jgi:transcription antitermination factor NusA-like protein
MAYAKQFQLNNTVIYHIGGVMGPRGYCIHQMSNNFNIAVVVIEEDAPSNPLVSKSVAPKLHQHHPRIRLYAILYVRR